MTKNNNKSTAIILAAVLIAAVAGMFAFTHKAESPAQDAKDSWAIYWYMCGSNLESFYGCGSADLEEAMAANLSPNVSLVIETGGTYAWDTDKVSAGQIQRHVLNKDGFNTVDTLPDANMGEGETLRSFLEFCEENYPADKKMLLLWNHGGGSVGGVAFDETNSFDSLDLLELRSALEDIYPGEEVPFELVGFDACLMATIDVANIFADKAKYMVASEDLEPADGWGYTDWINALAADPAMDGRQLGIEICNAYETSCKESDLAYEMTLSVTDLAKVGDLCAAYDNLGVEALEEAVENGEFFGIFGRAAAATENFGGNTREQGYTNMLDLGHFARNCSSILPITSSNLLDAIKECVVYQVTGPYRTDSSGLSCYYSYSADLEELKSYEQIGVSPAFKYLYEFEFTGELDDSGRNYLDTRFVDIEKIASLQQKNTAIHADYSTSMQNIFALTEGGDDPTNPDGSPSNNPDGSPSGGDNGTPGPTGGNDNGATEPDNKDTGNETGTPGTDNPRPGETGTTPDGKEPEDGETGAGTGENNNPEYKDPDPTGTPGNGTTGGDADNNQNNQTPGTDPNNPDNTGKEPGNSEDSGTNPDGNPSSPDGSDNNNSGTTPDSGDNNNSGTTPDSGNNQDKDPGQTPPPDNTPSTPTTPSRPSSGGGKKPAPQVTPQPEEPAEPETPEEPAEPAEPETPVEPEEPEEPEAPAENVPETPSVPQVPETPAAPANPANPPRPVTPALPQNPAVRPVPQLPGLPETQEEAEAIITAVIEENTPAVTVPKETLGRTSKVRIHVEQYITDKNDPSRKLLIDWGESDRISASSENNTIYGWFDGLWPAINDQPLYTEIAYTNEETTIYNSPVMYNGIPANMHIGCRVTTELNASGAEEARFTWDILGVVPSEDIGGAASRIMHQLKSGDEIVPVCYVRDAADHNAQREQYIDEDSKVIFKDSSQLDMYKDHGEANYVVQFEMIDYKNESTFSEEFVMEISGNDAASWLRRHYTEDADRTNLRSRFAMTSPFNPLVSANRKRGWF